MSTNGRLTFDTGVISANVPDGAYMDAAVVGDMAGIEVAIGDPVVRFGRDESYRADPILVLDLTPTRMRELLTLLTARLDLPALSDPEWRLVVRALYELAATTRTPSERDVEQIRRLAERIDAALLGVRA